MDFNIPEELELSRDMVKKFVNQELEPISMEVEESGVVPENIVSQMKDLGLFGITIPEEYGGLGLGSLGECVIRSELAKSNACFNVRIGTNNGIGSMGIYFDGTEEQKQKYLPRIASGEITASFALSEPNIGSDASGVQTTAVKKGDHYVINGMKNWITNGSIAEVFTVLAVTDKEKRARGGITAFIVDKGTPGFTVGRDDKKMGQNGSITSELIFEDCIVPKENIIGGEGDGFKTAMKVLDKGRILVGALSVGAAEKLLELSIQQSKDRIQFGKPICKNQAIQWMLADMATEIYASKMMMYNAAWMHDSGMKPTIEAAMTKVFSSEMVNRVADNAVQIFGGMGYMRECPIERFYRDVRLWKIVEGTSEIQRIVISRELLRD